MKKDNCVLQLENYIIYTWRIIKTNFENLQCKLIFKALKKMQAQKRNRVANFQPKNWMASFMYSNKSRQ